MRRVHEHHVGAIGGECPSGHRAGEDAREVDHVHTGQRTRVRVQGRQTARRRVADAVEGNQRLRRDGRAMRMSIPRVEAAQRGDDQARVGRGLFERERILRCECSNDIVARHRVARRQPEQAKRAIAVVREVRMNAHPAAAARVQAGILLPRRRNTPVDREPVAAFVCRMTHVDRYPLSGPAAQQAQAGRCQRRCGDGRLRRGADAKR